MGGGGAGEIGWVVAAERLQDWDQARGAPPRISFAEGGGLSDDIKNIAHLCRVQSMGPSQGPNSTTFFFTGWHSTDMTGTRGPVTTTRQTGPVGILCLGGEGIKVQGKASLPKGCF
jgi:hypothetical protein